jgi:putative ABC transport system permease protein
MQRVQALGSKTFFVTRIPLARFGRLPEEIRLRKHFTFDDARVIRESCPTVEYASAFATRALFFGDPNDIRYGSEKVDNTILRGVDPNYANAIPIFEVVQGRFISAYDQDHTRYVAAIGQGIANTLFPNADPIGRTVRLNGLPFEVIGVFEKDSGMFGGPGVDMFVCIPYSTFHKLYPEIREHFIAISVRDPRELSGAEDEVVTALRRLRRVPHDAPNDFEITMPDFLTNLWNQLTGALVILTGVISSIALLVGGIGVMNIMLVSVTERTAEIGVRKAVGARRSDIRAQFLIEAVTLTSIGGVAGILIGAAISWTVQALLPALPTYVSPFWAVMGLLMAAGVGLFFGYYPARRAANLDPIVCLRYE